MYGGNMISHKHTKHQNTLITYNLKQIITQALRYSSTDDGPLLNSKA